MQTRYVIERRETPEGQWVRWPHTVAFSVRSDADAQRDLLASVIYPRSRPWHTQPEFRVTEVVAGCPRCIAGAEGHVCSWHQAMENVGARVDAPRPISEPKPVTMSPKVRRSPRSGYSRETIAQLRRHQQGK